MKPTRRKLYPLVAVLSGVFVIVFGLVTAKTLACTLFLCGVFVWLSLFGCLKSCLRMLPGFIPAGAAFVGLTYLLSGDAGAALAMGNRLGALCLGMIPGVNTDPVRMTRSLSQMHTPRAVTLGMLIALSFVPMLRGEIRRVREAMRTRGAGSVLNPKIFYRAFLIPLVMRLVNISDTLALSVETRGFTLGKAPYTIYKKEKPAPSDFLYVLGLLAGAAAAILL